MNKNIIGSSLKILFTVESYFPILSGVPVVVKYLAEGLAQKGHEVTIATRYIKGCNEEEIINNVLIKRFNIYRRHFGKAYGNISEYVNYILNEDYDIIINECTQCMTTDLIIPYLGQIKAKKILHAHGFSGLTLKLFSKKNTFKNTVGNTLNWIRWRLYYSTFYKCLKNYDKLLCLSDIDSSKEYMLKYAPERVDILGNAVEDIFFESIDENLINKHVMIRGKGYFLSVANYTIVKNQISILREFYKSGEAEYDMVFIGSQKNEYYEKLQKLKAKLDRKYGYRNVSFLTNIPRVEIPSIINGATLYLIGSTYEEFSISICEAMSQGVPFISTDVGNARILPGGVTIKSIHNMHKEIRKLCIDKKLMNILSNNGRKYALNEMTKEKAVNHLEELIKKICVRED